MKLDFWLTISVFCVTVKGVVSSFNCYACSYTITSDYKVNYECANAPWNFTLGQPEIPCSKERYCITKTVYYADKKKIKSMSRSCGTPEKFDCGKNCCQQSTHDFTCQYQCQEDLCNNNDETKRLSTDVGGGASGLYPVHKYLAVWSLMIVFVF